MKTKSMNGNENNYYNQELEKNQNKNEILTISSDIKMIQFEVYIVHVENN